MAFEFRVTRCSVYMFVENIAVSATRSQYCLPANFFYLISKTYNDVSKEKKLLENCREL